MRVRTSADSIRNLERLLAFDEAAGSRGMWSGGTSDPGVDGSIHLTASDQTRDNKQSVEAGVSNRHSQIPTGPGRGSSAIIDHY